MGYISRYDRTFISFMNRKYKKHNICFEFIDDYRLWLYEDYLNTNVLIGDETNE